MILIFSAFFLAGFTLYLVFKSGKPLTDWFNKKDNTQAKNPPKSSPDSLS
jgi:hypothetical protein